MTPEEIVDALRTYPTKKLQSVALAAADLIERQATEIEYLKTVKEAIDNDWSRKAKALDALERLIMEMRLDEAIATIRAARGKKPIMTDAASHGDGRVD